MVHHSPEHLPTAVAFASGLSPRQRKFVGLLSSRPWGTLWTLNLRPTRRALDGRISCFSSEPCVATDPPLSVNDARAEVLYKDPSH